jgi:hypothetical protein
VDAIIGMKASVRCEFQGIISSALGQDVRVWTNP